MAFSANFVTLTILLLHKHVASNYLRTKTSTQHNLRIQRSKSNRRMKCTVFSTHFMSLPGTPDPEIKPEFRCVTNNGRAKSIINAPEDFFNLDLFESGKTRVSVDASGVGVHTIDITAGAGMIVTDASSRTIMSSDRNSNFIVAVIRVSDKHNHSPDHTAAQISNSTFGTGGAPLNLVVGYQACSGNKVNFSPATGPGFSDGVMELELTKNVNDLTKDEVEDAVTNQLEKNDDYNRSMYTNVMYILPKEVKLGGAGYGYVNGHLSVFSNQHAAHQYVLMHEIGHNFGHHHSGAKGISKSPEEYADDTGMMGNQVHDNDMPRACFNAAKSWHFGWYDDRHTEVTPTSGSAILNMLSIDDYLNNQATSDDQYTIARIVGSNEDDLFVMYNRAEGINYEVRGHRDQVTIVRQKKHGSISWLEAGIGFDKNVAFQWMRSDWDGSGRSLVIQICDKVAGTPDYASVIVYLEGENDLSCDRNSPSTCASGESNFKTGVLTDNNGGETEWLLKERNSEGLYNNIILRDTNLRDNLYSEKEKCLDNSKCYKFEISDEGKDGICCGPSGNGWYQIEFDDEIIKDKNITFEGSREATVFGVSIDCTVQ